MLNRNKMKNKILIILLLFCQSNCIDIKKKEIINNKDYNFIYDIDFFKKEYCGLDGAYVYFVIINNKWEKILKERKIEIVKIFGIRNFNNNKIGNAFSVRYMHKNIYMVQYDFLMNGDVCEYVKNKKEILKNLEVTIISNNNDTLVLKSNDISNYQDFFDNLIKGVVRPDNSKCK